MLNFFMKIQSTKSETSPAESFQRGLGDIVGGHHNVSRVVRATPRQYRQRIIIHMFML